MFWGKSLTRNLVWWCVYCLFDIPTVINHWLIVISIAWIYFMPYLLFCFHLHMKDYPLTSHYNVHREPPHNKSVINQMVSNDMVTQFIFYLVGSSKVGGAGDGKHKPDTKRHLHLFDWTLPPEIIMWHRNQYMSVLQTQTTSVCLQILANWQFVHKSWQTANQHGPI